MSSALLYFARSDSLRLILKLSNQELCSTIGLMFFFGAGRLDFSFALATIDQFAFAVTFAHDSVFSDAF
jgi:hypothetical protein